MQLSEFSVSFCENFHGNFRFEQKFLSSSHLVERSKYNCSCSKLAPLILAVWLMEQQQLSLGGLSAGNKGGRCSEPPPPPPYRLIVCVCVGGGVNTDATSPPVPQHTPTRDRFRRGGGSLSRTRGVYPDSREVGAMQPSPEAVPPRACRRHRARHRPVHDPRVDDVAFSSRLAERGSVRVRKARQPNPTHHRDKTPLPPAPPRPPVGRARNPHNPLC
jgi:hypothetical protein